jgi:hypothetical protein
MPSYFLATWPTVSDSCNDTHVEQADAHIHGSPTYWRGPTGGILYVWGEVDYPKAYKLVGGTVATQALANANPPVARWVNPYPHHGEWNNDPQQVRVGVPSSVNTMNIAAQCGMPGGMISVSANGSLAGTGVVWATHVTGRDDHSDVVWGKTLLGTLYAFDAMDLRKELWTSDDSGVDSLGNFAKFVPPVVADGRVFVATRDHAIQVYGLKPSLNVR